MLFRSQQNAALVEESAAAARAMHEQATELSRQVSFFQVGGQAAAVRAPRKDATQVEMETLFASVRETAPAPAPRASRPTESADAAVWKEF